MSKIEIRLAADGAGAIALDGRELDNVRGFTLTAAEGHVPVLDVTLDALGVALDMDAVDVEQHLEGLDSDLPDRLRNAGPVRLQERESLADVLAVLMSRSTGGES